MSNPPRATFILFAYNQEAYVAEAIAGAFAQDYPDLEIILSDDGSSDGSFAIIEEAVCRYDGPHRVIASRTPVNAGLLAHIYHAVAKASGDLIVVAAGDDVSLPQRVSVLVDAWRQSGALALSSYSQLIDRYGKSTGRIERGWRNNDLASWFADGNISMVPGASAAYDRKLFEAVDLPDFPIFVEDVFFSLMLRLRSQRVFDVPEVLVQYRAHGESMINRPLEEIGDMAEDERRQERYAEMRARTIAYVAQVARTGRGINQAFGTQAPMCWPAIEADLRHAWFRANWIDASLTNRFVELIKVVGSRAKLRWLLPRVGGLATLRVQRAISASLRRAR